MERISNSQQARTVAAVLAIGTANPPNCVYQSDYTDWYFRVTNNKHKTELKDKFRRIFDDKEEVYIHVTEEFLRENPSITTYEAPSLDAWQAVAVTEVPKLGKEAALKAIGEWGRPVSELTHLIFCTSSGINMPGADLELTKLLGLSPSIQRFMLYQSGCYAAGPALRLAKDIAENNRTARVLVVCSEITLSWFHAPCGSHPDVLVGSALFADGAAAVVVGAEPDPERERPVFQLVSARQAVVPGSEDGVVAETREMGLTYRLSRRVPSVIADNVVERLVETVGGGVDWRSLFYVVHPGGPAVLKGIEERLGLTGEEMGASRHVLREFGNMWSPSVLFVMDHLRKKSAAEGKATTGEGKEWGVLLTFGPGLTVETVLLRSVPISEV